MSDIAQDLGGVVLLPCPFCGSEMKVSESGFPWHPINDGTRNFCIIGGLSIHPHHSGLWNTRTHSAEIAGALRDAERYRWLREQASWWLVSTPDAAKLSVMLPRASIDAAIRTEGCDFDTAIDSAMQQA